MPIFDPAIFSPAVFDTGTGGSAGPLTFGSYLWQSPADVPTHTFTGLSIGAASANRWVIAAVLVNHEASRSVTGVTIGGVSATELYEAPTLSAAGITMSWWKANVPTGTTANVAVTCDSGWYDGAVATYHCIGEPTFHDGAHDATYTGVTFSVAVDVPEGGAVLALVRNDGAGVHSSWGGVTADQTDNSARVYVASQDQLTAETNRAVSWTGTATSGSTGFFGLAAISVSVPSSSSGVAGTSAVTLDGVTQSALGQVAVKGASSVTLAGVSQTAAGQVPVKGSSSVALEGVTQTGSGTVGSAAGVSGTSSVTLDGVTQSASGQVAVKGASGVTLAGVSPTAAGQVQVKGSSAITLTGVSQSATGRVPVRGSSLVTLDGISQDGAGQVLVRGGSSIVLEGVTQVGAGTGALPPIQGVGFAILEGVVSLATGRITTPVEPPYDWAPPVDLASSGIIGQALRFMRLAPIPRHDVSSELLPALVAAFDSAIDECLSAADWSFASVLAVLPGAAAHLVAEDDMPTLCMLPGDLVQLRDVWPAGSRWRVDGTALRTNAAAPVTIRYTARITREHALPATFKAAVSLNIALLLGARWAGAAIEPDDLAVQLQLTLKQALREDARHASGARAIPMPDLGYGTSGSDWAMEAVA